MPYPIDNLLGALVDLETAVYTPDKSSLSVKHACNHVRGRVHDLEREIARLRCLVTMARASYLDENADGETDCPTPYDTVMKPYELRQLYLPVNSRGEVDYGYVNYDLQEIPTEPAHRLSDEWRWAVFAIVPCEPRHVKQFKPQGENMTLQDLLKMKVKISTTENCTPEFRVAVQQHRDDGSTHFIIHADGHNSETLDFLVTGNTLEPWRA